MPSLETVGSAIASVGALGTAAFGLVDATKVFGGGISRVGFGRVRAAVAPFVTVVAAGEPAFGAAQILETLQANWMNGMPKADQKAVAKSLIRLRLGPATAQALAGLAGVNAEHLQTAAQHIHDDADMTQQDMKVLGAFDVAVSATLDFGYERGDQLYRNAAKTTAALIAVVLAVGGTLLVDDSRRSILMALLVGLVATPLAPVAKDVSTAIQTAVKAVGSFKR